MLPAVFPSQVHKHARGTLRRGCLALSQWGWLAIQTRVNTLKHVRRRVNTLKNARTRLNFAKSLESSDILSAALTCMKNASPTHLPRSPSFVWVDRVFLFSGCRKLILRTLAPRQAPHNAWAFANEVLKSRTRSISIQTLRAR